MNLPQYLDSFDRIYKYERELAIQQKIRTEITADYMLSFENNTVFLFFVADRQGKLILSDIIKNVEQEYSVDLVTKTLTVGLPDYTRGQRRPFVVLYKDKRKRQKDTDDIIEIMIDKIADQNNESL